MLGRHDMPQYLKKAIPVLIIALAVLVSVIIPCAAGIHIQAVTTSCLRKGIPSQSLGMATTMDLPPCGG
jgi:hypothetical protein